MTITSFFKPWGWTAVRLVATSNTVFVLLLMVLTFTLAHFFSWATATAYSERSIPSSLAMFKVAISTNSDGKPFGLTSFEDSHRYTCCLRLPKAYDSMVVNEFEEQSYEVITSSPAAQVIEVAWLGEDVHTWSRYRTTPDGLVPISFRTLGPGHTGFGFLMALVLSFLSRWVARLMNAQKAAGPSTGQDS